MERLLLILDIDETLVHANEAPEFQPGDFQVGPYAVHRRPHLAEFLAEVAARYDLAVWSSASREYVEAVVANVFPEPAALKFVWTRERCVRRFHPETMDYYPVKDLHKVRRRGYRLERMLVLDDTPEKLERHYGNLLPIAPFEGRAPDDDELRAALPAIAWLAERDDIRRIEKRNWRRRLPPGATSGS